MSFFKCGVFFSTLEDSQVFIINYILRKIIFNLRWAMHGYFGHINNKYNLKKILSISFLDPTKFCTLRDQIRIK